MVFLMVTHACFGLTIITVDEPPGNFKNADGEVAGMAVEFVREIQNRLDNHDPIDLLPSGRAIHLSLTRKNVVIFSLSRTEKRETRYHWISTVMLKPLVLFGRKGENPNIRTLEDAKTVGRIGVMIKSVQHDFLKQNGFTNIMPAQHHSINLTRLASGWLDLMYHSMNGMTHLCRDRQMNFNQFEVILIPQISKSYIAMSKDSDPNIVRLWQQTARDVKKDGTFNRLARKWVTYTRDIIGMPCEVKNGSLQFWED